MKRLFAIIIGIIILGAIANQNPAKSPTEASTSVAQVMETDAEREARQEREQKKEAAKKEEDEKVGAWILLAIRCERPVERAAKYGLRWVAWISASRFKYRNRIPRADGHIILVGDQAEAQNKFGDWIRVNYSCEYDPTANAVVDVQLDVGRLPRIDGTDLTDASNINLTDARNINKSVRR